MKSRQYLTEKENKLLNLSFTLKKYSSEVEEIVLKTKNVKIIFYYVLIKQSPIDGIENFLRWNKELYHVYNLFKKNKISFQHFSRLKICRLFVPLYLRQFIPLQLK